MIPVSDSLIANISIEEKTIQPSLTFEIDFEKGVLKGKIDELESLKQAVLCRLITEKGLYPIYSQNYGIPMNELIGQSAPLVYVFIASAITGTLLEDDRITSVYGFMFDTDRDNVTVSFYISTVFGTVSFEEVELNV